MKEQRHDLNLSEATDTGEYMYQCTLEKKSDSPRKPGIEQMTAWIPEKFAKVGKFLRIHKYDEWEDGWEVKFVNHRMVVDECRERSRDYRKQRKASDI